MMANEVAQKLVGIGVSAPTAKVLQKQIAAGAGNVQELIRAAITPNVAQILAPMITANSIDGPALVNARMPAPVVNVLKAIVNTPPVNTVAPVLSGDPIVDEVLSVTDGVWTSPSGVPVITYKWFRDADELSETSSTYTVVAADVGSDISVLVEATNDHGSAVAASNSVGPVTAA